MTENKTKKKVLIAPLDWGLGHATRCIPIIQELLKRNIAVTVASSGGALQLLRMEFPELSFHEIISYHARYSRVVPFMLHIFLQLPKFLFAIAKEHRQIERLIETDSVDLVISDNRYGAWSPCVPSVFVTHQVNILMPAYLTWLSPIINFFNHRQIRKFNFCWVPDWPDSRLTGKLSISKSIPIKFIGPLSRMRRSAAAGEKTFDLIVAISGPEPQRTRFEEIISLQLDKSTVRFLVVRGLPTGTHKKIADARFVDHLSSAMLMDVFAKTDLIISRPGYSTVMDLVAMGKKAIFIPTPGQTEQEYLARKLESERIAFFQNQSDFDLGIALVRAKPYSGFEGWPSASNLLPVAIEEILERLK